jgi:IMP dehydrogenase/GMP reductase
MSPGGINGWQLHGSATAGEEQRAEQEPVRSHHTRLVSSHRSRRQILKRQQQADLVSRVNVACVPQDDALSQRGVMQKGNKIRKERRLVPIMTPSRTVGRKSYSLAVGQSIVAAGHLKSP